MKRVADVSIPFLESLVRSAPPRRKRVITSGGDKECLLAAIDALELTSHFDQVVARDGVERGKPDPEIFLAAAFRVDVRPGRCLVFEDIDEGLATATNAGMDSIDVRPLRLRVLGY